MSNLISHMRTSAEAGNANAQFNLGVLLGNGLDDKGRFIGVQRDEAISWLRKAAESGLSRAQCKLAELYAAGDEAGDLEQAGAWFLVAMDNTDGGGRQTARDGFEKLTRRLSPEELVRARDNAETWTIRIENGRTTREHAFNVLTARRA
jgi:hypothetical protein